MMKPLLDRSAGVKAVAAVAAMLSLASCSNGADTDDAPTVRFALDWTPNTNHTGLHVAEEKGYFEEAGVTVELLPYNGSQPDTLVDAGAAECGIGFQDATTVSVAGGAQITSVLALQQHWATAIAVRGDNIDIERPADLDGKTFAGFGAPAEGPIITTVIQADGGSGEFESVILDTGAYETVYEGTTDFTIPYKNVESIEAELRGTPFKHFEYTDFGLPDNYATIVVCNNDWLAENEEIASSFVQAVQRGYEDAQADPAGSADILVEANPDGFSSEESIQLAQRGQELLSQDYMLDENGEFGGQTEERWTELGQWLLENELLTDNNGAPIAEAPDWSTFFTNDYVAP